MTASQDNEWEIKALQDRYKALNDIELDTDQAYKVLMYEQELHSGSSKYFFSMWEELDYDQVNFQEILTSAQFEKYMAERPGQLKRMEETLIESDKGELPQLRAAEEKLLYYKNVLIPQLRKDLMMIFGWFVNSEKEKIDFLKSEYKKYLGDAKRRMLVEHFRHGKTFQPIGLKLSLLLHQQKCLLPDYLAFKATMDLPTKAVADYLLQKLIKISEPLKDALKETMTSLGKFNAENTAKHIGEMRGWHTTIQSPDSSEELMFVVFLDAEKYTG